MKRAIEWSMLLIKTNNRDVEALPGGIKSF